MSAKLINAALASLLGIGAVLATGQIAGAYAQDIMARPALVATGGGLDDAGFLLLMALCVVAAALLGMVVAMWTMVGRSTASLRRSQADLAGWPSVLAAPHHAR